MKKLLLYFVFACNSIAASSQTTKSELYDLIKKLITDSSGYENVGDWGVKSSIKWKTENIVMSEDTSINFYRLGTVDITIKGQSFKQGTEAVKWNIMLKGPRMGYTSFSIISSPAKDFQPKYTIDSLFGKKNFMAKLLKSCDAKALSGYYYYEVKLPKKDIAFIKFSWISVNGNTAIRIDCYDNFSKYAVKLDCPK
jgi:hypothetical protein